MKQSKRFWRLLLLPLPCAQEPSGFGLDNFSVCSDFEENGAIGLLIYYAPPRFQETD